MNANEGAGAFAIEIEIADMKLAPRPRKPFFVSTVDSSGQAKLRVIGDAQRVVIVVCFDHREYWSENLLLFNRRAGLYVGNNGWFDKETLFAIRPAAAQNTAAFSFALFDITIDCLERFLVDHRAHRGCRLGWFANLDLLGALDNFFQQ